MKQSKWEGRRILLKKIFLENDGKASYIGLPFLFVVMLSTSLGQGKDIAALTLVHWSGPPFHLYLFCLLLCLELNENSNQQKGYNVHLLFSLKSSSSWFSSRTSSLLWVRWGKFKKVL